MVAREVECADDCLNWSLHQSCQEALQAQKKTVTKERVLGITDANHPQAGHRCELLNLVVPKCGDMRYITVLTNSTEWTVTIREASNEMAVWRKQIFDLSQKSRELALRNVFENIERDNQVESAGLSQEQWIIEVFDCWYPDCERASAKV